MAHQLDFTKGQAAIAFRGATPWHGLGAEILPQDDIEDIRIKAGLDYDVNRSVVLYDTQSFADGTKLQTNTKKDSFVLYRSDTGDALSIVSDRYQVVQPKEVVEFYRDLTEKYGYELEVVGALSGGKRVWALANTTKATQLRDNDEVKGYLLLATSYDGTMATQARFTSVRVVCNNTLTLASGEGRADVTVPHSTKFDADKVKLQLQVGEAWERYTEQMGQLQRTTISRDDTVRLFLDAYFGLRTQQQIDKHFEDEKRAKSGEKLIARLTEALFNSPGANLASARGTLWGALNAVTYDVDHQLPSRSADTRLNKAWFGTGNAVKQRAFERVLEMAR